MPSTQAPVVETAVIAKRLAGESKSKISRDLEIDRSVVTRILNESEVDKLIGQSKSILYEALPDAARNIARAVQKSTGHAWELLDRTGVMPKQVAGATTNVAVGVNLSGMPVLK